MIRHHRYPSHTGIALLGAGLVALAMTTATDQPPNLAAASVAGPAFVQQVSARAHSTTASATPAAAPAPPPRRCSRAY